MHRSSASKGRVPRSLGVGGFTLVELLISISIIGIMTGMMLANFHSGQQSAELRLASDILVDQLRSVQTSSLSGRLVSVCSGGANTLKVCEPKNPAMTCTGGTCQKRVPTGYGIRFTTTPSTSYTLFYDTDGDLRFDVGEDLQSVPYISTNTIKLNAANVSIPVDLVYTPPYGKVFINGSATGTPMVSLTLGHQSTNKSRHVNIFTLSGRIEHD